MTKHTDILVLGGGAAGFFAACSAASSQPGIRVTLLEKSAKFLAKVKVSGGGRCNVTCGEEDPKILANYYPRGGRLLSRLYFEFGPKEVKEWFISRGVKLKTEADGRVFPVSDSSQTIIDCLMAELSKWKVETQTGTDAVKIEKDNDGFRVYLRSGEIYSSSKIIVATGGTPKAEGMKWLEDAGHKTVSPLPSLFTFNAPGHPICKLMGVSVPNARIRIAGTKFEFTGPLLITHWGISGPAVLKLSAFAAKELAQREYTASILINWADFTRLEWEQHLDAHFGDHSKKRIENTPLVGLPSSLWKFLLQDAGISFEQTAGQLGPKQYNRLLEVLINYTLNIKGKTTFKEEFVTAGGISLHSIDSKTMESKVMPGLYFAGEIVDVDGITGGYNFQAAWTTGYIAGKHAAQNVQL